MKNTILKLRFILTSWCGEHAGCWHNSMWDPQLMPRDRSNFKEEEKRAQITLYTNMKLNPASPGGFYSTQKLWNLNSVKWAGDTFCETKIHLYSSIFVNLLINLSTILKLEDEMKQTMCKLFVHWAVVAPAWHAPTAWSWLHRQQILEPEQGLELLPPPRAGTRTRIRSKWEWSKLHKGDPSNDRGLPCSVGSHRDSW